jgi:hypothetical protein
MYEFSEGTRSYPKDGGSWFLRNADTYVPYSMKHSRQRATPVYVNMTTVRKWANTELFYESFLPSALQCCR